MLLAYGQWGKMSDDEKKDLIAHMEVSCARQIAPEGIPVEELKFVDEVCIRILKEYAGRIDDANLNFAKLVHSYDRALTDIYQIIGIYHQEIESWISTSEAAEYIGCSEGYVRRLARRGIPTLEAKKHPKGWRINLVSINDWLIRTKRVQID